MTERTEPQTLFNSLVGRINDYTDGKRLSAFESAALKRDAEKLKKVEPSDGYRILGMIACLERDIEEMHRYHKLSIRLAPDRQHAIEAYAVSLSRLAFDDEAVVQLRSAYEIAPGSIRTLEFLIDKCMAAGRVREANRWGGEWKKLCPEKVAPFAESLSEALSFFDSAKLADDDVARVLNEAGRVIRENGQTLKGFQQKVIDDPEESGVGVFTHTLIIGGNCGADVVASLIARLAKIRAAQITPSDVAMAVVANFRRYSPSGRFV